MIDIQNLHFGYKKGKVFNGLSLQLQPGHIYGLLGKNGTGKSTLLRNIAGLLFPDKGSVRVLGLDPSKRQPAFLNRIFLVPEEFYVPPVRPARFMEVLAPFYPHFNKEYYTRLLLEFEIPLERSLQQMSYGQKKKVLISLALASGAQVVLMDEPTNGLDIISKSQFRKVLAGTADEEKCIVISTHQVRDLENLIDRVTIIDEGKILFDQTLDNIQTHLQFKISFDSEETRGALYSESSLKGNALVVANTTGEEGKVDLELLYKAIIMNRPAVLHAFQA
ncbi:ABC transporter ATP-binding protein [Dinghuibacter silviterrae]|uniref:ABC-2 type transport system ATP-binding protein n=1 Tax=Dinghuibacter silviterrae TaxID=1539049 RepID=A0A4R8DN92_9BACT|nr:ATP-binding cassette domain-containing protein [Dinghuibacter silviterrae]TDW99167.1 ABC-2 type transport system ATP-binding protein [Dinghuibacter silviterrae]